LYRKKITDIIWQRQDLENDLQKNLRKDFEDLIVGMFLHRGDFLAKQLKDAMHGLGTDEEVLNSILCCVTSNQLEEIVNAYSHRYKKDLENDIKDDTSGLYEQLLVQLVTVSTITIIMIRI